MQMLTLCFMQDVEIDEEVDVIISEWMGYMLLYEVSIIIFFGYLIKYIYLNVESQIKFS